MHACMHTYMRTGMHAYITYVHIHMFKNMCIYIYIYSHTSLRRMSATPDLLAASWFDLFLANWAELKHSRQPAPARSTGNTIRMQCRNQYSSTIETEMNSPPSSKDGPQSHLLVGSLGEVWQQANKMTDRACWRGLWKYLGDLPVELSIQVPTLDVP